MKKILEKIGLYIAIPVFIFGAFKSCSRPSSPPVVKELTHEQKMWERVGAAKDLVKRSAHDPDSIIFDEEYFSQTKDTACIKYRGKNAYGGVVRGVASLHEGKFSIDVSQFKKVCS